MLCILCDCAHACKLLLCGDIEENPGPTVEEMLESLTKGQQAIRNDLLEVKQRVEQTEQMVMSLGGRLSQLESETKGMAARMNSFDGVREVVMTLQETIRLQHAKIVDLEDKGRRNNLVVFGVEEASKESELDLRRLILDDIFKETLRVTCSSVDRIHRIGKPSSNRPVILHFCNFTEKQAVMLNAKKLKGTTVFIQNDYSQETLRKRRSLWQSAKSEKDKGKKVTLVHDKLYINKKLYAWNDSTNRRVPVQTNELPAPANI